MTRIAFLGLGAMGARMARHLVADFDLVVYNRTPARADGLVAAGARQASSPREAAAVADIVISMVTDDHAAEALWMAPETGALHGLKPGALALECSTVSTRWVARLGAAIDGTGARFLDAPVAGTTPQAEAGSLVFLVGGGADDVAAAKPVFERVGGRTIHAGPRGHGALIKLAVNALFAIQVATMGEILAMLDGQGISAEHAAALLSALPVTSPAAAGAARLMVEGRHPAMFSTDLVIKDLNYAGGLGRLPIVDAARARFEVASAAGFGAANLTSVHRVA